MNSFSIADVKKALKHLEDKYKSLYVKMEIDENNRLNFQIMDTEANAVKIVIYRSNEEGEATKFPEIVESRRL